jgi:hypothetical protein
MINTGPIQIDWHQADDSRAQMGQGRGTKEEMSAACKREAHPRCYKLKCTCECHEDSK